jgi:hypothetical protein
MVPSSLFTARFWSRISPLENRFDRSWGHFFESFEDFLSFSWPVITVTDAWTGRAHIVTRLTSIGAFLKMIKTRSVLKIVPLSFENVKQSSFARFGETLPTIDSILKITPFETGQRHLRTVSDRATYRKIHSTLPAAVLAALKTRIRAGEIKDIRQLWSKRDNTFLAMNFEWSERNKSSCLEWGYAALRCSYLDS